MRRLCSRVCSLANQVPPAKNPLRLIHWLRKESAIWPALIQGPRAWPLRRHKPSTQRHTGRGTRSGRTSPGHRIATLARIDELETGLPRAGSR